MNLQDYEEETDDFVDEQEEIARRRDQLFEQYTTVDTTAKFRFRRYKSKKYLYVLRDFAQSLTVPGKGLLGCDEDPIMRMSKRFAAVNIDNTPANRRAFRHVLVTANPKISKYISAYILHPEVLDLHDDNYVKFTQHLKDRNIAIGVSADKGLKYLPGTRTEYITNGMDDLKQRLIDFKNQGCQCAAWRSVFRITKTTPTTLALEGNCFDMAKFASICQEEEMLPILQIEILLEGDYNLQLSRNAHQTVMATLFKSLHDNNVCIDAILLNTSIPSPGIKCSTKYKVDEIALATVEMLRRTVPPAVPCVTFISGGLDEEMSTNYLNAINRVQLMKPWALSFSFGRALTDSCLRTWAGLCTCTGAAQTILLERCKANSLASKGEYSSGSIPVYSEANNLLFNKDNCI